MLFPSLSENKQPLLTKREVKMVGYRPSSISARLKALKNRYEAEVHKHPKKNEANIQPS